MSQPLKSGITALLLTLAVTTFASDSHAGARTNANVGHVFVGVSTVYYPGAIRIGGKNWEVGTIYRLNPGVLGLLEITSNLSMLAGLGIGEDRFFLAGGINWDFYTSRIFDLRLEAYGLTNPDNRSEGRLTLGITLGI